jgi:hypothetical protein
MKRHSDLSEADVIHAVANAINSQPRLSTEPMQYVGVGPSLSGSTLEWIVVALDDVEDGWYVYHAMPATKKVLRELGMN